MVGGLPSPRLKGPNSCQLLADLVWRHGVPAWIIHYKAPEFLSDVLQDTAVILGLQQLPTFGDIPKPMIELNRTLKAMLTELVRKKGYNWDTLLEPVLRLTIPHYKCQPENPHFIYCMIGMQIYLLLSISRVKSLTVESEYGRELLQEMKQIRQVMLQRIKKAQRSQKD